MGFLVLVPHNFLNCPVIRWHHRPITVGTSAFSLSLSCLPRCPVGLGPRQHAVLTLDSCNGGRKTQVARQNRTWKWDAAYEALGNVLICESTVFSLLTKKHSQTWPRKNYLQIASYLSILLWGLQLRQGRRPPLWLRLWLLLGFTRVIPSRPVRAAYLF